MGALGPSAEPPHVVRCPTAHRGQLLHAGLQAQLHLTDHVGAQVRGGELRGARSGRYVCVCVCAARHSRLASSGAIAHHPACAVTASARTMRVTLKLPSSAPNHSFCGAAVGWCTSRCKRVSQPQPALAGAPLQPQQTHPPNPGGPNPAPLPHRNGSKSFGQPVVFARGVAVEVGRVQPAGACGKMRGMGRGQPVRGLAAAAALAPAWMASLADSRTVGTVLDAVGLLCLHRGAHVLDNLLLVRRAVLLVLALTLALHGRQAAAAARR